MTTIKKTLLAATALSVGAGFSGVALADGYSDGGVAALKRQLEEMQARIEELEAQSAENTEALNTDVLRSTGTPGGYRIPGTDTTFRTSGFIRADYAYDFSEQVGDASESDLPGVGNDDLNGDFNATAITSRLRIDTSTPTSYGALRTRFETDFRGAVSDGDTGRGTLRLRHAYATLGSFGFGQTNSLMSHPFGEATNDFLGSVGSSGSGRRAQVRYTTNVSDELQIAVSLENPTAGVDGADSTTPVPRMVGRATYSGGGFGISGAVGAEYVSGENAFSDEDQFVWGAGLAGEIEATDALSFVGQVNYASGLGFFNAGQDGDEVEIDASGDFEAVETFGFMVGATLDATDEVQFNVAYGYTISDDDEQDAADLESAQSLHANVRWSPVSRVRFGLEGIYQTAEIVSAADDDDSNLRALATVVVNF